MNCHLIGDSLPCQRTFSVVIAVINARQNNNNNKPILLHTYAITKFNEIDRNFGVSFVENHLQQNVCVHLNYY